MASLLIIDDEIPLLYMMTSYFVALGYEVVAARDIDEAHELIIDGRYAVVISDLELCDPKQRRGFDLLRQVRRVDSTTRTILLTAYGSPEARREAAEAGVDVVLDKPQPLKKLAETVARLIEPNACHVAH